MSGNGQFWGNTISICTQIEYEQTQYYHFFVGKIGEIAMVNNFWGQVFLCLKRVFDSSYRLSRIGTFRDNTVGSPRQIKSKMRKTNSWIKQHLYRLGWINCHKLPICGSLILLTRITPAALSSPILLGGRGGAALQALRAQIADLYQPSASNGWQPKRRHKLGCRHLWMFAG